MAKKKVQPADDNVEVIVPDVEENNTSTQEDTTVSKKNKKSKIDSNKDTKESKNEKSSKNSKNDKGSKNKKEKKSLRKRASEVISELKKVSKPTFGKVVKNTCVVIAVVAICTVLLLGLEKLFSLLYKLLLPNA